jgi:DNA recombination protein RmuC
LAIEKRSSEVWQTLGQVKTEFGKFGATLDAVKKKLTEASNKIDETGVRSRVLERKLRDVEALPYPEDAAELQLPAADDDA